MIWSPKKTKETQPHEWARLCAVWLVGFMDRAADGLVGLGGLHGPFSSVVRARGVLRA